MGDGDGLSISESCEDLGVADLLVKDGGVVRRPTLREIVAQINRPCRVASPLFPSFLFLSKPKFSKPHTHLTTTTTTGTPQWLTTA